MAVKLVYPKPRRMPSSISIDSNRPTRPPTSDNTAGLLIEDGPQGIRYWTEHGELSPRDVLKFTVGKYVYTSCEPGLFESVFSYWSPEAARKLSLERRVTYDGFQVQRSGDGAEASYSVATGGGKTRQTGYLVNARQMIGNIEAPEAAASQVLSIKRNLDGQGIETGDMRSFGHIVNLMLEQALGVRRHGSGDNYAAREVRKSRRADLEILRPHARLHWESFRAARFETTSFGWFDCYDYDLISAYPSFIADLPPMSELWTMDGPADPSDLPGMADEAEFAAIRCKLKINTSCQIGPIMVRYRDDHCFSPVGTIESAWLNLPEIRLLLDYPDLGQIVKVYEGSWFFRHPGTKGKPYRYLMDKLFKAKDRRDESSRLMKKLMVVSYGKFASVYPDGKGELRANVNWNPMYAAHVTASMRSQIVRHGLTAETVLGEFADGLTVTSPLETSSGMGGLRQEAQGRMLFINDMQRESDWHKSSIPIYEALQAQRDRVDLRIDVDWQYRKTLDQVVRLNQSPTQIGQQRIARQAWPIGSTSRLIGPGEVFRVGHVLDRQRYFEPPQERHIPYLWDLKARSPVLGDPTEGELI